MTTPDSAGSELERIKETYQTCVDLVDDHLAEYDPARDDIPELALEMMGLANKRLEITTVRFNVLEQPPEKSLPLPYSSLLGKASVVAFQKIEFEADIAGGLIISTRKIELLDPFQAIGGATLLMVNLTGGDPLPEAEARDDKGDKPWLARPFYDPELTNNLLHMAITLKRMSAEQKLVPISFLDIQAMYGLHDDLSSE